MRVRSVSREEVWASAGVHWEVSLTTPMQWVVTLGVCTSLTEPAAVLQYLPSTNPDGYRRRAKQEKASTASRIPRSQVFLGSRGRYEHTGRLLRGRWACGRGPVGRGSEGAKMMGGGSGARVTSVLDIQMTSKSLGGWRTRYSGGDQRPCLHEVMVSRTCGYPR